VRQNPDGSTVRLKRGTASNWDQLFISKLTVQREACSHHTVYQAPGSNALAVAKQVKAQMKI
jgi:hypothetical protein